MAAPTSSETAPSGIAAARADRRARRRAQVREELLDAATALMAEDGVATLNLSAVARRVGMSQPSIYTYFQSRTAVFDALFERGMRHHRDRLRRACDGAPPGWPAVRAAMHANLGFAVEEPALAELLFQRPVPGFEPSAAAYAPALEAIADLQAVLADAVDLRHLHPDAATEDGLGLLLVVTAGVCSQLLANEPGVRPGESRWARLLDPALDMWSARFAPPRDEPEPLSTGRVSTETPD